MRALGHAALLLACGCAGLGVNKRSPANIANGALTPTLPPAANYGPDATKTCPTAGANGEVASLLAEQSQGKTPPQQDGRLCEMAETLLSWDPAELPPDQVLSFLSFYFGLPQPARRIVITSIESEDVRQLAPPLADGVQSF